METAVKQPNSSSWAVTPPFGQSPALYLYTRAGRGRVAAGNSAELVLVPCSLVCFKLREGMARGQGHSPGLWRPSAQPGTGFLYSRAMFFCHSCKMKKKNKSLPSLTGAVEGLKV